MEAQLRLIDGEKKGRGRRSGGKRRTGPQRRQHVLPRSWSLDHKTRERGLAGVQQAREVLASAKPPPERFRRAS